jgi:hypothetical protein
MCYQSNNTTDQVNCIPVHSWPRIDTLLSGDYANCHEPLKAMTSLSESLTCLETLVSILELLTVFLLVKLTLYVVLILSPVVLIPSPVLLIG